MSGDTPRPDLLGLTARALFDLRRAIAASNEQEYIRIGEAVPNMRLVFKTRESFLEFRRSVAAADDAIDRVRDCINNNGGEQ